jgi:hypothetical protein
MAPAVRMGVVWKGAAWAGTAMDVVGCVEPVEERAAVPAWEVVAWVPWRVAFVPTLLDIPNRTTSTPAHRPARRLIPTTQLAARATFCRTIHLRSGRTDPAARVDKETASSDLCSNGIALFEEPAPRAGTHRGWLAISYCVPRNGMPSARLSPQSSLTETASNSARKSVKHSYGQGFTA